MGNLVEGYPVVIKFPVQWGDMDAFQHVNNVSYFRYLETPGSHISRTSTSLDSLNENGVGPILAATSCRFKAPLTYPDTVLAAAKVTAIEKDRFMMDYRIVSTKQQKVAAEADSVIVTFDYRANKKVPVPEEFRRLIMAVEDSASHVCCNEEK